MSDVIVWPTNSNVIGVIEKKIDVYLNSKKGTDSSFQKKGNFTYTSSRAAKNNIATHEITPVFGKYITRNQGFLEELRNIQSTVKDYAQRGKVIRPLNILLAAEPGNGKSFLIKQLTESLSKNEDVQFMEYHVAAFRNIDDLLGVFQRIQSFNLKNVLPLVLFDEIDALVDGRYIFPNLLAPMWDGCFHIGRESFSLGRAVFVFAASNLVPPPFIKENKGKKIDNTNYADFSANWRKSANKFIAQQNNCVSEKKIEKVKDFLDRVDIWVCIPPIHYGFTDGDAATEQVDIACLLVKKHFPKIVEIEISALKALTQMLVRTSSRRFAECSVFCSQVPNETKFKFEYLPQKDQKDFKKENDKFKGQYLNIVVK